LVHILADGNLIQGKLPTEMIVPAELETIYKRDREYVLERMSDWLSEETGFCHDGFEIEKVITKETVENELLDNKFNDTKLERWKTSTPQPQEL